MSPSSPFVYAPSVSSDQRLDLDDPFIGILGEKGGRESLWLGKAVPRYTSYPPATAFDEVPTVQEYRSVLAALPVAEPLSLYFHVPFCRSLCFYCGCNTCATNQHERVTRYMGYVHREMENIALSAAQPRKISHIHFGGGSPNILSEKDLGLLFGSLMRRFNMRDCREIAMELDPRLITKAQVRILGMLGVNRVSLGVQDFNPEVMHAIGRKQSYEMIRGACDMLREAGINDINFDLIYGLPLQSPASLIETAQEVVSLLPNRVALFSYAHVPQVKKHQKILEQYILPGPHACLAMEAAVRRVLVSAGYAEIGMDHFALPDDPLDLAAK
ncbi:MAG: radical SAM protein, partial [Alphaproteobacteria bacterium]|nr:radical SAM protein [Alphaproteobacteria bacterium]